ncbi:hypothetical protein [Anabaena sp. AL09]|jgi:hypothetical protein|uniref:hypothetical protein n=1 Tax=Anabaena sp. AL09 TaxID=1710891 RepID=UPI0007FB9E5D|nr:hypothetical protein [Anabaena sp. AL09]OBQ13323.1 MAG: hypothetical protein AN490_02860 [Anabaena sp. AL09]
MPQPTLKHIIQFQSEYHELITQFTSSHNIDELTARQIVLFMDEVKYFWIKRLDIIDVELESLTEHNICFLLSGAIYLNVSENENFYFKSLGDFHLLHDPFLKIEHFFRIPECSIDMGVYISYFRRVLIDSIKLLESYKFQFFILPIQLLAVENEQKHRELLDKFFMNFISTIFGKKYENQDSFCEDYNTFEDIENHLEPYVRDRIVFNSFYENGISLRRKIEMHNTSQPGYTQLMADQTEAKVFLVTLYSYVTQISDILLICSMLRLYPYIRYEVTFSYLSLIMYTFIEDEKLRDMIEKAIVFYIFRKKMDGAFDHFESFEYYCEKIAEKEALPKILNSMRENDIDIFQSGIQKVAEIIQELFADVTAV